ncbi:hypothetical protein COBT_003146, partial [Conglomerata obtusa]
RKKKVDIENLAKLFVFLVHIEEFNKIKNIIASFINFLQEKYTALFRLKYKNLKKIFYLHDDNFFYDIDLENQIKNVLNNEIPPSHNEIDHESFVDF